MSRTAKPANLTFSSVQLLGGFLTAVVFFGAAVAGGFLAGYRRGFIDHAFDLPAAKLPLLGAVVSAPPPAERPQTQAATPAEPILPPGGNAALQAAPADPPARPNPLYAVPVLLSKPLHVQVSTGRDLQGAEALASRLAARGYPAAVDSEAAEGRVRVVLGPYYNRAAANDAHDRLKADGIDSLILFR